MYRLPIRKGDDVHLCLTQTLILVGNNFLNIGFWNDHLLVFRAKF